MEIESTINFKNIVSTAKLFIGIIILCLFHACNHKSSENISTKYSRTQQGLFDLLNKYDAEYESVDRKSQKDSIVTEYLIRFDSFLEDSLSRRIDSMLVTVDTITNENLLVTTKFHSRQIELKFGLRFEKEMDSTHQAIYNFLNSLKSGNKVLINFIQLGEIELGPPVNSNNTDDSNKLPPTLIISAVPEPTQAQLAAEKYKLRNKK